MDLSVLVISSDSMKKEIIASEIDVPENSLFRLMAPNEVKGLESDSVVIVDPAQIIYELFEGDSDEQMSRWLYVMCTRATKKLLLIGQTEWELDNLLTEIAIKSYDF